MSSTTAAKSVFPLAEARRVPLPPGRRSAGIFAHGTLEVRLYAPRGVDSQTPHDRDEVYVVAHGRGQFFVDGRRWPFVPGDLLFVPAHAEHRFEDFSDDLEVWVLFYGPVGRGAARRLRKPWHFAHSNSRIRCFSELFGLTGGGLITSIRAP